MSDLDLIKKYYGEDMSHFCHSNFPGILETKGLLFEIFDTHFDHNKFLFQDIVNNNKKYEFKEYIYSFVRPKEIADTIKTPFELMSDAGYLLYECRTEEDIQAFKKFYADGEELCTFKGGRLDTCYVFFAVKKDVNNIKREDFRYPLRQDRYGTSVISIQFDKGNVNTLSIKNRYNHKVANPDSTFSNDLENIIAGLTKSFENYYGFKINSNKKGFEIPGYVLANDKKYYKYNYEINNIYYCTNNIIIDNFNVIDLYKEKERYIVFDYFLLDLKLKKIYLCDLCEKFDSFVSRINGKGIKKIEITKENNNKLIYVVNDFAVFYITLSKENRLIKYREDINKENNEDLSSMLDKIHIGNYFLEMSKYIEEIYIPDVTAIGKNFNYRNESLEYINIDNVERIDDDFLFLNNNLKKISAPKLRWIGTGFLTCDIRLEEINLPKLNYIPRIILGRASIINGKKKIKRLR